MTPPVTPRHLVQTGGAGALALAAALAAASATGPAAAQQEQAQATGGNGPYATPAGFERMVADKLPSVVGIVSTAPDAAERRAPRRPMPPGFEDFYGPPEGRPGPRRAQGSGFVISADGLVVTNSHVVAGADAVQVLTEGGEELDAEIVGTDPATDIALLRIPAEDAPAPVDWGASSELEIGEWVVAIGNPFGLDGTVTTGILSARSRDINSGPYDNFLQTDAAINTGNSGGPLFNTAGEVVGVNTAIFSPSGGSIGIGFAVPSDVARSVVLDLEDDGVVQRGYLGVRIQPVDEEMAAALGIEGDATDAQGAALVAEVAEGSPAEAAGLQSGDVIVAFDGQPVTDPRDLTFAVSELEAGATASVTVLRGGSERELEVTIGEQPADLFAAAPDAPGGGPGGAPEGPRIGVRVAPLDAETRAQADIPPEVSGLLVAGVQRGSPAARAGLRPGDVIAEAGGAPATDAASLRAAAAAAAEADRPILLRIWREGNRAYVAVPLGAGGGPEQG